MNDIFLTKIASQNLQDPQFYEFFEFNEELSKKSSYHENNEISFEKLLKKRGGEKALEEKGVTVTKSRNNLIFSSSVLITLISVLLAIILGNPKKILATTFLDLITYKKDRSLRDWAKQLKDHVVENYYYEELSETVGWTVGGAITFALVGWILTSDFKKVKDIPVISILENVIKEHNLPDLLVCEKIPHYVEKNILLPSSKGHFFRGFADYSRSYLPVENHLTKGVSDLFAKRFTDTLVAFLYESGRLSPGNIPGLCMSPNKAADTLLVKSFVSTEVPLLKIFISWAHEEKNFELRDQLIQVVKIFKKEVPLILKYCLDPANNREEDFYPTEVVGKVIMSKMNFSD